MNGLTKYLIVGVPIVLALIAAMVSNDQLSRGRDTALQGEITRVELQQTEQ